MKSFKLSAGLVAGLLVVGGCDIPTEAPIIEQRWQIPVEETSVAVDEFLPAGVSVSGDDFDVTVDPVFVGQSLGSLCPSCIDSPVPVPVPAFTASFASSSDLPADVSSVVITSGTAQIAIQNGLSFDPLAGGGSMTITLSDGPGGAELGQVVLDGTVESLPAGSTVLRTLSVGPGSVTTSVQATTVIVSNGGQVTTIDTSDEVSVTATTESLLVSSATVDVAGTSVDLDAVDIDVEDLDSDITDRILAGTILLDVENPFGVGVDGTIVIGTVAKGFSVPDTPTSTVTLSYTGNELRSFLGQPGVQFSGSGTVTGGPITVSPGQEMTLDATLDFTIQID